MTSGTTTPTSASYTHQCRQVDRCGHIVGGDTNLGQAQRGEMEPISLAEISEQRGEMTRLHICTPVQSHRCGRIAGGDTSLGQAQRGEMEPTSLAEINDQRGEMTPCGCSW